MCSRFLFSGGLSIEQKIPKVRGASIRNQRGFRCNSFHGFRGFEDMFVIKVDLLEIGGLGAESVDERDSVLVFRGRGFI